MEERILREILAVTKENNEILHRLNMQRKWVNVFWVFKWLLVIAIAYSAYVASKPYIDQAQATYNQAQEALTGLNNLNVQAKQMQNMDQKSFIDFITSEAKKRLGQ